MIIQRASEDNLPDILALQQLAFRKEAEAFADFNIQPITQSLEELAEEFKTCVCLVAMDDSGRIIGSTRGSLQDGTSHIGRTFVHPDEQGKGIGTRLIRALETLNPAQRYEISSSIRCPRNISLYEHLGYVPFQTILTETNGFVSLEKTVSDPPRG